MFSIVLVFVPWGNGHCRQGPLCERERARASRRWNVWLERFPFKGASFNGDIHLNEVSWDVLLIDKWIRGCRAQQKKKKKGGNKAGAVGTKTKVPSILFLIFFLHWFLLWIHLYTALTKNTFHSVTPLPPALSPSLHLCSRDERSQLLRGLQCYAIAQAERRRGRKERT